MNVRAKLLMSQSLDIVTIVGVAIVEVVVARRFDYELRHAELAYDRRQTITQLTAQAFHCKSMIDEVLFKGRGKPGDLDLARRAVRDTLNQLAERTERESAFVQGEERLQDIDPPTFRHARSGASRRVVESQSIRVAPIERNHGGPVIYRGKRVAADWTAAGDGYITAPPLGLMTWPTK